MRALTCLLLGLGLTLGCSTDPSPSTALKTTSNAACDAPDLSATERLFDENAPPRLFEITVAPDDLAFLDDDPRREEYVPATVALEGEVFANAGIRYKGAYGSLYACFDEQNNLICDKLSMKVSFNKYVDGGRFMGVRKLVFNSAYRDRSYLRERLSYSLFRAAGLPASRVTHARLSINGGPESLFVLVENIDEEWIEDRYDDDSGNLYKEVWPQHTVAQPYIDALRNNEDVADVTQMVSIATALAHTDEAALPMMVDRFFDRDALLRHFAVDQMTLNWDGIWKFYCWGDRCGNHNFYLYDDPTSRKLQVIAWDLDHTFTQPNPDMARSWWADVSCAAPAGVQSWQREPQCDPILRGAMRGNWDAYKEVFRALTQPEAPLSEAVMLAKLNRYRAMIAPYVDADPKGPSSQAWQEEVAVLRQVIRANAQHAQTFLAEDP